MISVCISVSPDAYFYTFLREVLYCNVLKVIASLDVALEGTNILNKSNFCSDYKVLPT